MIMWWLMTGLIAVEKIGRIIETERQKMCEGHSLICW